MTASAESLASRGWRWRNSTWLLPVIFLFGIATWASFLYLGLKAKRRDWLIASAVFGVAAVAIVVLGSVYGDDVKGASNTGERIEGWIIAAAWLGGIAYGLWSNRDWLRWKAKAAPPAWYFEGVPGGPAGDPPGVAATPPPSVDDMLLGRPGAASVPPPPWTPPGPAAPPPPWLAPPDPQPWTPPPGPQPWTAQAGAPAWTAPSGPQLSSPPPPRSSPGPVPRLSVPPPPIPPTPRGVAPSPSAPLDLNTISAQDLTGRLGLDAAAAERVVNERARLGGFTSTDQLMTVTGMEPHVFAAVRHLVIVSRPAPDPGGRGRRLDL